MRLALALALSLFPALASAQGTYDGQWRPGPQRMDVTIDSWGSDCPARPASSTTPGGAPIHITQAGDDLSFPGGRSTSACWSDNPGVRRVSRTYSDGTWRVVCRTPPEDARSETGTYTLHATSIDTIEYREVTSYDWTLNASHCTARLTTTQTFERVGAAPPPTTTAPPPTTTTTPEPACTPGPAARVAMRPASANIATGERTCFTARLVDANGCAVRGGDAPTYELRGSTGELRGGCFSATASSGSSVVIGHVGTMSGEATVNIVSSDLSDLIAGHTTGPATVDDGGDATLGSEARVASRGESSPRGMPTWAVVASIAGLVLVLFAVVGLLTRGRRKPRPSIAPISTPLAQPVPPPPAPVPAPVAAPAAAATEAKICPICRRGYPGDVNICPKDNEPLVLYSEFVQRKEQSAPNKVCPKCGTTYPSTTRFCGKDGTTL